MALTVMGGSMHRRLAVWKEKYWKLFSGFYFKSGILGCLQMSLDTLDDKDLVKKCFVDLGCFPEDQNIPVNTLLDMWEELYNLNGDDGSAMSNIDSLCKLNLTNIIP